MYSKLTLEKMLDDLQSKSCQYFLLEANPITGLILDKTAPNWPGSIAATGLGLTIYPVAVERGYMTREDALIRTLNTLRFFYNSPQGPEPDATGYKGFYYHFLDMKTGRRAWQSELSTVDTAFLLAGMLAAAVYFNAQASREQEVRTLVEALYRRVDWQWALNGGETIIHGWKPESGFIQFRWEGYDEALLLYMLALGSPTYPLPESSYKAWASTYIWKNCYNIEVLYAGPLFTHQLSHVWIDFRKIQDAYMREKDSDYFENSRRATYVQQKYAIQNPLDFVGYGECCWGLTASDGPGPDMIKLNGVQRQFYDYIGRGVPYGPDDGTVAPWAAVTSLPFAPDIVLGAIEHYITKLKLHEGLRYGFRATFNQTHPEQSHSCGWVSPWHYGINEGPIVLMIENYRTDFVWSMMRECPYIVTGLKRAGFSGGWIGT